MRLFKKILAFSTAFMLLGMLLSGCDMTILTPKGQVGMEQRDLIYIAIGLMLIVVIPAMFMAVYFFWKYRETNDAEYLPNWSHSNKIEAVVWIVPIIIITILSVITWVTTHRLDPYRPLDHDKPPINIQVISLDWKWLFIYPDYGIATVNEIAFPSDTPVAFKITSDTVMNSFFIPGLGGQVYSMAGMQTQLHLIANEPGKFKGISAGYSGHGFSDMKFTAISTKTPADFDNWVKQVRASQHRLVTDAEFNQLARPTDGYPVTYYSKVKPGLYRSIIDKFMSHDGHAPEHHVTVEHKGGH